MANALSGYAWWEAEGHGARIAAVLVNAASDLAALAVEAGLFDWPNGASARPGWSIPTARPSPRAAMQVAAAAGDADRLRREWRDCQRRIDELDPAARRRRAPSALRRAGRRVLVGAARRPAGETVKARRVRVRSGQLGGDGRRARAGRDRRRRRRCNGPCGTGRRFGDHVAQQAGEGHLGIDPQIAGQ